jgi:hypothetical protein
MGFPYGHALQKETFKEVVFNDGNTRVKLSRVVMHTYIIEARMCNK